MFLRLYVAAFFAILPALPASAAELKSGPQVGEKVPGTFRPLNITGKWKGEKQCLYCACGDSPVVMIFARTSTPEVTKLIKKIDHATAMNAKAEMKSFVVYLSDKAGLDKELAAIAVNEKIKLTILSIDNPAGPKNYHVAEDADVTVVLYVEHKVKANHAFKTGEITDADIDMILADLPKILSN